MKTILAVILLAAFTMFGEETNFTLTVDGFTYRAVRFGQTTPVSVTIFHSAGVATVPLEKLPGELQKQLGYDQQKAAEWETAQQKAAAEVAEAEKRAAGSVEWRLTVEKVVTGGVVARGRKTMTHSSQPMVIFLVDYPKQAELGEGSEVTTTAYRDGTAAVGIRTLEKWVYYQAIPRPASRPVFASTSSAVKDQVPTRSQTGPTGVALYFPELRRTGVFGFPQEDAKLLCNRSNLRFSAWNNGTYLFAQAILWQDGDISVGEDADGDPLGDYSCMMLNLDDDGKDTPDLDRVYYLNLRPNLPGLRYATIKSQGAMTGPKDDSEGRGAIRYVTTSNGRQVRVDTYLIPLQEILRKIGDKIGICYYAYSPAPHLSLNSVTEEAYRPRNKYHKYVLASGPPIDALTVPEGRNDVPSAKH